MYLCRGSAANEPKFMPKVGSNLKTLDSFSVVTVTGNEGKLLLWLVQL